MINQRNVFNQPQREAGHHAEIRPAGSPRVYEIEDLKPHLRQAPNGALLAIFGGVNSPRMGALLDALDAEDFSKLKEQFRHPGSKLWRSLFRSRKAPTAFVELRYAGRPLKAPISLSADSEITSVSLAFHGGRFEHSKFSTVYSSPQGGVSSGEFQCVIFIIHPALTSLEQKIRDRTGGGLPAGTSSEISRVIRFDAGWAVGDWVLRIAEQGAEKPSRTPKPAVEFPETALSLDADSPAEAFLRERTERLQRQVFFWDRMCKWKAFGKATMDGDKIS